MLKLASLVIANLTSAGVISGANATVVIAAINAGATATAIIALIGGGGITAYIVRSAFKHGAKKVIIAA